MGKTFFFYFFFFTRTETGRRCPAEIGQFPAPPADSRQHRPIHTGGNLFRRPTAESGRAASSSEQNRAVSEENWAGSEQGSIRAAAASRGSIRAEQGSIQARNRRPRRGSHSGRAGSTRSGGRASVRTAPEQQRSGIPSSSQARIETEARIEAGGAIRDRSRRSDPVEDGGWDTGRTGNPDDEADMTRPA
jgi:hypothetical protein